MPPKCSLRSPSASPRPPDEGPPRRKLIGECSTDKLLGDADSLARTLGKGSAQALVEDTPSFVWAFLLGTLAVLLLVLVDCCGVRTACAQCCGERGGPGPCTRCWRSLRSCLLGGRWRPRYYDAGPAAAGYDRYESDDFAYDNDYRRTVRPEKGYGYV